MSARPRTFAGGLAHRFSIVAVLSILCVGVFISFYGVQQRRALAREYNQLAAAGAAHEIAVHLDAVRIQLEQIGETDRLDPREDADFTSMLEALVLESPSVESAMLLDDVGTAKAVAVSVAVRARSSEYVGVDRSSSVVYSLVKDSDHTVWCDVYPSVISGDPVVSVAVPLDHGVLVADVSVAGVGARLLDVADTAVGTPVVVDGRGVVVCHRDPAIAAQRQNWSAIEPVAAGIAGRTGDFDYHVDGRDYLASTALIPELGWTVLNVQSAAEANRPVWEAAVVLALLLVALAIVAGFVARAQSRSLSRPLAELAGYARRIGEGEYGAEPRTYRYAELSGLAESMHEMGAAIRERERLVSESEASYRYLLESLDGVPWEYDVASDRFVYVGPQAAEMLGRPPEEWTDLESWSRMVHPDDRETAVAYCETETKAGRDHSFSYRVTRPGGHDTWVRDIVSVCCDDETGEVTLSGVLLDITAEKEAEETRLLAEKAQAASEAKSGFISRVSHELRTPLNSIIGFSGVLSQGMAGELNEEQRIQVEMIEKSGRHLLAVVTQLLDIRRIEAGREDLTVREFDFGELLDDVAAMTRPMADGMGLDLIVEGTAGDWTVRTDIQKVRQVILNLLANAVRHTAEGSVTMSASRPDVDTVAVAVTDTGPGMSSEATARAFEEFGVKHVSPDGARAGTGLGLPISRRFARMLGGDITVESTPGVGSTFTFRFAREL